MKNNIYSKLLDMKEKQHSLFCLIDPDKNNVTENLELAKIYEQNGADVILIGGSIMVESRYEETIRIIKKNIEIPVIIFPGLFNFVTGYADAILLLNMLSSRNPQVLIEEQVRCAPQLYNTGLESIPTGYILIESGNLSSVQYMSHSLPIPHKKNDIALIHALAGQYMGMKMIYLEAGSGAKHSVPNEMIKCVSSKIDIPLIVGGGIRTPESAKEKAESGADFIVIGTVLEELDNYNLVKEISEAVHSVKRK
ncbi:MAG: geranylgeranylglyceryl/heptaprenylglyceryl phosphate synthase [Candidatus Cloacimonadales bacterium]|jgi:phosphoglycerol geranylgeranyltransferase|nr:geranylgeranylglyceryl/heptaprenylglyceryl phosphate synthase [Candidatus Cloacimonadota bacterium]MDD2651105.1 geranylgeranylglyceryl/heptaprenylglyceryl phosphate synthase [Candidatus Cloacimonadota bacterium]MDD3501241.1 geranylgeranylglyceryl/heptaprenylglyceryl phosphate synthase [Candidatus Cloacimonadota bacterium]MDX9977535.1 geranylgeranylglyceryl/heptaprenylglyceryl phosphate synthase [Candidatus Cloacimonadales bacterium]